MFTSRKLMSSVNMARISNWINLRSGLTWEKLCCNHPYVRTVVTLGFTKSREHTVKGSLTKESCHHPKFSDGRVNGLSANFYSDTSTGIDYGGTKDTDLNKNIPSESSYLYFHPTCYCETKVAISSNFSVVKDFISEDEEKILFKEVEPHLRRLKYEYDHWDDAIHGYREVERSRWSKAASSILKKKRLLAFPGPEENQLPQTHILDLAENGVIKPHVDSVRFCGNIICGLSLLSDAVMRLVKVDHKDQVVDIFLQRRSLYIMKDAARYNFTHEVLSEKESYFGSQTILRGRRVSIISRNHPRDGDDAKSSTKL